MAKDVDNPSPIEGEPRQHGLLRSAADVASSRALPVRRKTDAAHTGNEPTPFTLSFVLGVLRRWWGVVLPCGILLSAAAIAVVYLTFKPVYQAVALLQISDNTPYIAFQSGQVGAESRRFLDNQIELIRSPLVIAPVVGREEIAKVPEIQAADAPIVWLSAKLKIAPRGRSELVNVAFEARDPTDAAKVVNAVVETYLEYRGRDESERTQRVIELLEEEKARRTREVETMRESIRDLAKQVTGKDPFAQKNQRDGPAAHPMTDLQTRLVAAEVDRQILELKMQAFEELIAKEQAEVPEAKLDQAVDSQSSIVAMKNALLEKKDRLKEYERTLVRGNQDRLYVTLQEEIRVDEENLQKTRSELRDSVREEIAAKMGNEHKDALARGRAELDSARLMERLLRERNDALKKDVQEATGDTLQLEFKQAELARAEQVFTIIADRAIKLRTEQRAPSRVMCLLKADPPVAPVEWLPFKRMAVAGVGGMGLLLLLAMAWEWFAHRVSDSQQIELHARLPVLGEITRLPVSAGVRRRSLSGRAGRDLGMFEESIDSLRTSLVLSKPQDMQVLAITSASNSEGKTSVALQLAVSIARSTGQRVLLIDADMRSPDIHELLEIRHSPGLAEVLGHKCVLQEAIVTEWSKFVHVIPAGKLTTSPHKLLGNGALKTLLDEVRGDYRYVVIDTPPILAASEALVLAKAADACLFCAMRDVSRIDRIRRSCDRLAAAGANPIGVVLSGISIREYSHEYGSYYGFSKHESVHETAGTAVDG